MPDETMSVEIVLPDPAEYDPVAEGKTWWLECPNCRKKWPFALALIGSRPEHAMGRKPDDKPPTCGFVLHVDTKAHEKNSLKPEGATLWHTRGYDVIYGSGKSSDPEEE